MRHLLKIEFDRYWYAEARTAMPMRMNRCMTWSFAIVFWTCGVTGCGSSKTSTSYCNLTDGRAIQMGASFSDGCNCCVCTSTGPTCQGAACRVDSGVSAGSCQSDSDCAAQGRLLCAFNPGCDSPIGTCLGGNGICPLFAVSQVAAFEYCGCDGVTYPITNDLQYPYKPYRHFGACP